MEEIWVPSTFNVQTMRDSGVVRPIHVLPLGVDPHYYHPNMKGERDPRVFTFLSVFEWGERKAPEVLLRAFSDEFRAGEDVVLLLKVVNRDGDVDVREQIARLGLARGGGRVLLSHNDFLPNYQLGCLYRSADCLVLASRGEGWGMPALEGMACGLPVIATNWSAMPDFIDESVAYPLAVDRLVPAQAKCPYYQGFRWAEPSYDHLRALMRHVFEHPQEARERGARAAQVAHARWTWDHAAERMLTRLRTIERPGTVRSAETGILEESRSIKDGAPAGEICRSPCAAESRADKSASGGTQDVGDGDNARVCHAWIGASLQFKIVVGLREPKGDGTLGVDPVSARFLDNQPNTDAPLLRLMLDLIKPGQVVLDLGAHIGTFALTAAAAGCRVIAFEASPRNVALLRASIAANQFGDRVKIVAAAVSNHNGTAAFCSNGPWGHLATAQVKDASAPVPAVRVDDALAGLEMPRADFLKMDIEGSEIDALTGMQALLGGNEGPPILYESNYIGLGYYGKTPRALKDAFHRLGYHHHYLVRDGSLIPVAPGDFQGEVVGEYLTTKAPFKPLPGWIVRPPLSMPELIRIILDNAKIPDPRCRAHLARALSEAPRALLNRPEVQCLLKSLAPIQPEPQGHPEIRKES
jgi:FkbM family methyltransferase